LRFKQNGFGVYTGGILQGIVEQRLSGATKIGYGRIGTAHVEHCVAVHVEEHLIDHVGDVKLGLAGFGDVLCFGQGTTGSFAIVDGDQNVFVHGAVPVSDV